MDPAVAEKIQRVVEMLQASQSGSNEVQQQVRQTFEEYSNDPHFNEYLVYILTRVEDVFTRTAAGLILKNNVRFHLKTFPGPFVALIKQESMKLVGDPNKQIRATVGTLITTIALHQGIISWPELLPGLLQFLQSDDQTLVEGAFGAFSKLCEDNQSELSDRAELHPVLEMMIHTFLRFFEHSSSKVRSLALGCCNQFIISQPAALMDRMGAFVEGLFKLAVDPDPTVRRHVCQALVNVLEVQPEHLMPQMTNIIQYMLTSTMDDDEAVALEACEFWLALADYVAEQRQERQGILVPYLESLLPVLLNKMRYSEDDIFLLKGNEEDYGEADKDSDIAPRHYKPKHRGQTEDEEDEDDDDSRLMEWNIRKCSAAALDQLATTYEDNLLPILLPLLTQQLQSPEWENVEAGILAIGAISEGCMEGMKAHLPHLFGFLLSCLDSDQALIKSITCWTLSRYSVWIVSQPQDSQVFSKMLTKLLEKILDPNKKVQEAACSAFATLEEDASNQLVPFLKLILTTLLYAFEKYQHKNLLMLYDAIGTLAESVKGNLNDPELISILMPPIVQKWNSLKDEDQDMIPLLECLASITLALGPGFEPYSPHVFNRCVTLIHKCLSQQQMALENPDFEPLEKDFLILAIDVLSGLADGLGQSIESLVANSRIMELLVVCVTDDTCEVRQSAFALLGDYAKLCFPHVQTHLHIFAPILAQNLEPTYTAVCNNAAWAIGEIAVQYGEGMAQFIEMIVPRLIGILCRPCTPPTLLQNAAITLGRLGLGCTALVAGSLTHFIQPWCQALRNIRDNEEKDSSFRGMCLMIKANPEAVFPHLIYFCDAVISWREPKPELHMMFQEIFNAFKNAMGPKWNEYFTTFPDSLRVPLTTKYGL